MDKMISREIWKELSWRIFAIFDETPVYNRPFFICISKIVITAGGYHTDLFFVYFYLFFV